MQPPNIDGVQSLLSHMGDEGESIGFKPPIGLLYVATFLKERTGHQITLVDGQAERLSLDQCLTRICGLEPDVVGVSAWTDWWWAAYELGRRLKERRPQTHLCFGGPHVSIYPAETLGMEGVDSIVVGDGEVPFTALCNLLGSDGPSNHLAGLHFKEFGCKHGEDLFYIQKNLDELPIPDRTLLPLEQYSSVLGKASFVTTMVTSRGCPHHCIFCKLNFQKTISRSAENVIEEFARIKELGIEEVEVYDDTFTWSKQRVKDICLGLIERKIKLRWTIRDRVTLTSYELLNLLKRAGCARIHFGIESGSDEVLKLIKKNITVAHARRAVAWAKECGLVVLVYFMLGNKGETAEEVKKTIDLALELDTDYCQISVTIPYPGTAMYQEALQKGIISHDYWQEFALKPVPNFRIPELYEEHLSSEEMMAWRDIAIRRFYFRPRYLLNQVLSLRTWGEFKARTSMGARLLMGVLQRKAV